MDWALRLYEDSRISIEDMYSKDSSKFTIAPHHSGKFDYGQNNLLVYSSGSVDFADYVDPNFMSIYEIILIAKELGAEEVTGCWYRNPEQPLHQGLTELAIDRDIVLMTKWVPRYRVIDIYVTHCQFPKEAKPLSAEYLENETETYISISDDEDDGEEDGVHDGEDDGVHDGEEDGEHDGNKPDNDIEEPKLDDSDELKSLESSDGEGDNKAKNKKNKRKHTKFLEKKDLENPQFELGQLFGTADQFKRALKQYSTIYISEKNRTN